MRRSRFLIILPLLLATPLAPAIAQVAAPITAGMQIVDVKGGMVGTVTAIDQSTVTLKTDRHEARLPRSSFTVDQGKLLFGMTQAELNAAIDTEVAKANAALVPGATVKTSDGIAVGTIASIDSEAATITLTADGTVTVPRSGISGSADGAIIGVTSAQLKAQIAGSAGASATATSGGNATTK